MDPVIRTRQDAISAVETYSPAEMQFNRRRRAAGLVAGPVVFVTILLLPLPVEGPAHRLAAVMGLMFTFWVSEALPVAATALLGPALAVMLRVGPAKEVFAPFADPIIFLFIGSFILAEAMYTHGLDRRIAYTVLAARGVATSPARVLAAFGATAALVSMWISNTATAAMLFPIALSLVTQLSRGAPQGAPAVRQFGLLLMLMMAFAASIGGLGTPVGTPPNLIGLGMLRNLAGVEISFGRWMVLGVPLVIALFAVLAGWFWLAGARRLQMPADAGAQGREGLARLGPLSRGERNALIAFGVTVTLWLMPGLLAIVGAGSTRVAAFYVAAVPESVAALVGALLLFALPLERGRGGGTLTWDEAARIDWGTILLFGGGLSIGGLAFSTGLAETIGRTLTAWLPVHSTFAYTALFTVLAVVLSEITSNTAAASMLVPVAVAVSMAAGIRPIEPALGATLGASMGFMLPISTPPNAIAYSSGHVPITAMMRYGVILDVVAALVIIAVVTFVGPLLF